MKELISQEGGGTPEKRRLNFHIRGGFNPRVANFFLRREWEGGRRDVMVAHSQGGKAKAEMRTCDEHVVPACTKFPGEYVGILALCITSCHRFAFRPMHRGRKTSSRQRLLISATRLGTPTLFFPKRANPAQPPRTNTHPSFPHLRSSSMASAASPLPLRTLGTSANLGRRRGCHRRPTSPALSRGSPSWEA